MTLQSRVLIGVGVLACILSIWLLASAPTEPVVPQIAPAPHTNNLPLARPNPSANCTQSALKTLILCIRAIPIPLKIAIATTTGIMIVVLVASIIVMVVQHRELLAKERLLEEERLRVAAARPAKSLVRDNWITVLVVSVIVIAMVCVCCISAERLGFGVGGVGRVGRRHDLKLTRVPRVLRVPRVPKLSSLPKPSKPSKVPKQSTASKPSKVPKQSTASKQSRPVKTFRIWRRFSKVPAKKRPSLTLPTKPSRSRLSGPESRVDLKSGSLDSTESLESGPEGEHGSACEGDSVSAVDDRDSVSVCDDRNDRDDRDDSEPRDLQETRFTIKGVFSEHQPDHPVDLHLTRHHPASPATIITLLLPRHHHCRLIMLPAARTLPSAPAFKRDFGAMLDDLIDHPDLASQHTRADILPAYVVMLLYRGQLQMVVRGPHQTITVANGEVAGRGEVLAVPEGAVFGFHYSALTPLQPGDVIDVVDYGNCKHQVKPTKLPLHARHKKRRHERHRVSS